jgi:hypothetical protein
MARAGEEEKRDNGLDCARPVFLKGHVLIFRAAHKSTRRVMRWADVGPDEHQVATHIMEGHLEEAVPGELTGYVLTWF